MDLNRILAEEEGDKSQAALELNIRIAQKIESPDINIVKVLSPTELCVLLICRINVYVCNGGYEHYFYYSGVYIDETVQAISTVGLTRLYKNYLDAIKVFGNEQLPFDDEERQALVEALSDHQKGILDKLSDDYYDIDHFGDLFDFAFKNQSDIFV